MNVEAQRQQDNWAYADKGAYAFVRIFDAPQKGVFRTVANLDGKTLDTSIPRTVTVAASTPSGTKLSADLGAKKLTDCSRYEQPCFSIVSAAGRRLLEFPAVTVNVGEGPLEIHAYRSSPTASHWIATRTTYYSSGDKRSQSFPNAEFYHAGDGHDHWHVKDFDSYQILDERGAVLRISEKHGFCLEDNTTYRDWANLPRQYPDVPRRPVYKHRASCGEGDPFTTSIVHGLSVGWADTYPTSLPDQHIDITNLSDGVYTVRVKVDGQDLVEESNEENNTATVQIRIRRDKVSVDARTATGL